MTLSFAVVDRPGAPERPTYDCVDEEIRVEAELSIAIRRCVGVLTANEIETALAAGYELRGLEVKGPGERTDSHLFAKVTRTALSLANLRDGGYVLIGLADDDLSALTPGLNDSEISSWLAFDDVSRKLATYADPPLRFDLADRTLSTGARVVLLHVHEFDEVPVLCAKGYEPVLRAGACYVRSRRTPETAEIPTAAEMRELLDLATEKAVRAYVERSVRAGVALVPAEAGAEPSASDVDQYRLQRGDLL